MTSITQTASSTCPRLFTAASTMRWFMRCIGLWMPGVSKRTICPSGLFTTARMRLRVVCGLSETMATFWPTRLFTSVDLPTLGRPDDGDEAGVDAGGRARSMARARPAVREGIPDAAGSFHW